jgi:hypothetical protein
MKKTKKIKRKRKKKKNKKTTDPQITTDDSAVDSHTCAECWVSGSDKEI